MEQQTLSIGQGEPLADNPLDISLDVNPEQNQKALVTLDASILNPQNAEEIAQKVESEPLEVIRQDSVNTFVQKEQAALTQAVDDVASTRQDLLPQAVEGYNILSTELKEQAQSQLAPHIAFIKSLEGSENLSSDEVKRLAVSQKFTHDIAARFDEQSVWDTGFDILGMMAVPDESINAQSVAEDMGADEGKIAGWFESTDGTKAMISFRNSLTPEEQVMWDSQLMRALSNMDDNVVQQYITGLQSAGLDPMFQFDQGVDKLAAVPVVGGLGKGIVRGFTSFNRLRQVTGAGDKAAGFMLANAAANAKGMAKTLGIPQIDAAASGNAAVNGVIKQGTLKGAPDNVAADFKALSEDVEEGLRYAADSLDTPLFLSHEEATVVLDKHLKLLGKDQRISEVAYDRTEDGISFSYKMEGEDDIVFQEVKFSLDDIGGFFEKESTLLQSMNPFSSPNIVNNGLDRTLLVKQAEALVAARAKVGQGYSKAIEAAWKPVKGNKQSIQKVSKMLEILNGEKKTYTYHDLVNEGVGGLKLTDKEFMAWKGTRRVLDDVYWRNNNGLAKEMQVKGLKNIKLDGKDHFSKVYDNHTAASMGYRGVDDAFEVYIPELKNTLNLRTNAEETLERMYEQGYKLVKSDSREAADWFKAGGNHVRFALVKDTEVKALPRQVLKREGNYLPRAFEEQNYLIKKEKKIVVDGREKTLNETVAWAHTATQAQRYIDRAADAARASGAEAPKFLEPQFSKDTVSRAGIQDEDNIRLAGGLFRSDRGRTELDFAGDIGGGKATDPLAALQKYINYTARRMPMNQWKMGVQERWWKDAASASEATKTIRQTSWSEARGAIADSGLDAQTKKKLLSSYDQIESMMGVPTRGEQAFQGKVTAVAKAMDRAGKENWAKHMYRMSDENPVNWIKSTAFNLTLGTFNLVQLPIQALGATVALAADPVHAPRALSKWMLASMMDTGKKGGVADEALRKMAASMDVELDEFKKDYDLWKRSGMYDSVVAGHGDLASNVEGMALDAGVLQRMFGNGVNAGQTFFKMGELVNMRISFFTALEREKAKHSAFRGQRSTRVLDSAVYSDEGLRNILGRAEQYRLNMGAGNKAAFQRGFWSLPLQFQQIMTKSLEAYGGSWFNKREKSRIFATQVALYGGAGVPILNAATDHMIDMFFDQGDLSSSELILAKRGIAGWMINDMWGIDALVSERLAIAADIGTQVSELVKGDTSVPEFVAGVSFHSGDRIIDAISDTASGLKVAATVEDLGAEGVADVMRDVATSWAKVPASGRRWIEAYDMATANAIFGKDGKTLYEYEEGEVSAGDIAFRAVGFGSQDADDLFRLMDGNRAIKEKRRAIAGQMMDMVRGYARSMDDGDETAARRYQYALGYLHQQTDDFDDRQKILDQFGRLLQEEDQTGFHFEQWINNLNSEALTATGEFNILATRKAEQLSGDK